MKQLLILWSLTILLVAWHSVTLAQSITLTGVVIDSLTNDEVTGARVKLESTVEGETSFGAVTGREGEFVFYNVAAGIYRLSAWGSSYKSFTQVLTVARLPEDSLRIRIILSPEMKDATEVVVSGTRSERSIDDVPVRVEVISQEEVEEKIMEKPSSVIELLNESAGTRIQETSASSGAANIRIQGLDGCYTQVLVDGIPSYAGLSSGFGLTQLAPLNLRRVEIIKGASSAVYAPDAIAGLLNFITKDPTELPEFDAVLNASSRQGYDASGYYGQKFDEFGMTALVSFCRQQMVDVDGDGFADIPRSTRLSFTPKFEYEVVDDLTGSTTLTYLTEDRLGGVMNAPDSAIWKAVPWTERNNTKRFDLTTTLRWKTGPSSSASVRASGMRLERQTTFGASPFDGVQNFRFGDAQYEWTIGNHRLQLGATYLNDRFQDQTLNVGKPASYDYSDIGGWAQNDIHFSKEWEFLASVRWDDHNLFGAFFTPRASLMYRPSAPWAFRLNAGTGFKAPTIFVEDAELYGFRNIRPLQNVEAELARSATFDVNYHAPIGDIAAKIDLALFTTQIDHALILNQDSLDQSNVLILQNATGLTTSEGAELTVALSMEDLHFTAGYTFQETRQTNNNISHPLELNPKHWLGLTLSYEDEEDGWKAGVESYYIGPQRVEDNPYRSTTPSYWLAGALIEKAFGSVHVFLNGENLFDSRQTRYESPYIGDPSSGDIRPLHVWAPLEGRTINGGIRLAVQ